MTYALTIPTVPQVSTQFMAAPTEENLALVAAVINHRYDRPPGVRLYTEFIKDMSDAGDHLKNDDVIIDLLEMILKLASYNRDYAERMGAIERKKNEREQTAPTPRLGLAQAGDDDLPF